jgi:hypothetical protein
VKTQQLLNYVQGGLPYGKMVNEAGQQQSANTTTAVSTSNTSVSPTTNSSSSSSVSTAAVAARAQYVRPAGFQSCLAVRYRNFKWMGDSGKVYR